MTILTEARKKKVKARQVSGERTYQEDYKKYRSRSDVVKEIRKVTQHFKKREDNILELEYNKHDLDEPLNGYSSLRLFPSETGDRDVVIILRCAEMTMWFFMELAITNRHMTETG